MFFTRKNLFKMFVWLFFQPLSCSIFPSNYLKPINLSLFFQYITPFFVFLGDKIWWSYKQQVGSLTTRRYHFFFFFLFFFSSFFSSSFLLFLLVVVVVPCSLVPYVLPSFFFFFFSLKIEVQYSTGRMPNSFIPLSYSFVVVCCCCMLKIEKKEEESSSCPLPIRM